MPEGRGADTACAAVAPEYQGMGVGRKIVGEIIKYAQAAGKKELEK